MAVSSKSFFHRSFFLLTGESKILMAWTSPKNHPEFEKLMTEKVSPSAWKGRLVARRCMHSTSKCDNLKMACDWIDTDVACLNDADTMLHWGCMVRASIWIKDQGYDIAVSVMISLSGPLPG